MTDHTAPATRLPLGSAGSAWWSVPDAVAEPRAAFAAPKANADGTGDAVGTGYGTSDAAPSVSIAA
ncbi:hypothetical protein [Halobaculum sp. EA56]|uniref:hypothetical protein n=1 Tax=Halobaculum sp. EA56 TaxID=3421648 RepID=UPI003EBCC180